MATRNINQLSAVTPVTGDEVAFYDASGASPNLTAKCTIDVLFSAAFAIGPGEGVNLPLGTVTGTKFGTATTQKIGFYNATPIVRPSAYTQTYSTADKTHANPTASAAALTAANPAAVTEYTPHASGAVPVTSNAATDLDTTAAALNTLVDETQALETEVSALVADGVTQKAVLDALIVDVADLKQLVNSVIDDLQALGLVG